jgi:hypothetical protein
MRTRRPTYRAAGLFALFDLGRAPKLSILFTHVRIEIASQLHRQLDGANQLEHVGQISQGECTFSIVDRYGHKWETIWNAPENKELRRERPQPGVLLAGDRISIPDLRPKTLALATGKRRKIPLLTRWTSSSGSRACARILIAPGPGRANHGGAPWPGGRGS